ncbi:MAG: PQQ-binding-like beta-propeller repeat protein [Akkermansiaceae bacterium]|nr:PQQ-binding-like beta-propeller repeat protein [Akkermansiaceae bacterium]
MVKAEESWWQFRGPAGDGHSASTNLPLEWDEKTNVVWKIPIHDRGWSSPVIWGEQIWITTATRDGHKLFAVCVHRESGKILHDLKLFDVESPMSITSANTYATPTPVIEAGRVYVHYGTYGTACLDTASGKILWSRRDLNCDHEKGAGPASSPTLVGDFLVVHVDGRDEQYVIALNKRDGETAWKTERSIDYSKVPVHQRKAYGMPILIPRGKGGMQLVGVAGRGVFAYDPQTGTELWKARHRGWSIAPRPVYGHGLVFAIIDRDDPELWAIRPDGSGDVTETHVAWRETKRMPPRASPLLVGELLYLVNRNGIATCLEARTGRLVWQERLKGNYSASPIAAEGRIYLFSEEGLCTVIKPSRKFEVLGSNALTDEPLMATPAIARDSLYIRTEKHLYRIRESDR